LLILFVLGVVYCTVFFFFVSPVFFGEKWLERGIFSWGWATAAVATGIALLKIVDPELKSGALDEYGIAYVGYAPIEIAVNIFAPIAVIAGFTLGFGAITMVAALVILAIPFFLGWLPGKGGRGSKGKKQAPASA
jgi:ESS family glutamate:Na+ symporter